MLISVQNVAIDSSTKLTELYSKVSSQGNSSNIPGLSQPGASAAVAPSASSTFGYGGSSAAPTSTSSSAYGSGGVAPVTNPISKPAAPAQNFFAYGQVPIPNSRENHAANAGLPSSSAVGGATSLSS